MSEQKTPKITAAYTLKRDGSLTPIITTIINEQKTNHVTREKLLEIFERLMKFVGGTPEGTILQLDTVFLLEDEQIEISVQE